jgi:hypothetical protein
VLTYAPTAAVNTLLLVSNPKVSVLTAEQMAERAAFVPEGVVRFLERERPGKSIDPQGVITAEGVAADLRETLKRRAAWWGGAK